VLPDDIRLLNVPGAPVVLPDGSAAVVSVTHPDLDSDEYRGGLWLVPLDGAAPRRLTRGWRDTQPAVSPDGRWLAFCRAEKEGKPQIHLVEAAGGEPRKLTDAPLGASSPAFSPDGTRLAYVARVPDEGRYLADGSPSAEAPRLITELRYRADDVGFVRDRPRHLFVLDVGDDVQSEPFAVTEGSVEIGAFAWFDDDALVGVMARHAERETDLRSDVVRIAARSLEAPVPLTDADHGSTLDPYRLLRSQDGTVLWFIASDLGASGRDFVGAQNGLFELRLDGAATPRRLTDLENMGLVSDVLVEHAGRPVVAVEHRGAVHLIRVAEDGSTEVLLDGAVVVSGAAGGGGVLVAVVADAESAGEVVIVGASTRLTDFSAELRSTGRVRTGSELIATSTDGYAVHGWLTLPDPERYGDGPHPTILMIHGGPFAQYTHALFDEVQVLVEAGYAVVHGNPRGSSGYGRAHGTAIKGRFGTVDADDVLALLDEALLDPALDGTRVGVMGGSYGGYMTAWLTTRTDRFVAAVVERGFLDPVSFVGSSDIGWFFGGAYLGEDATVVATQSPMAHVDSVTTPTLVIHSEHDWRCPVEQGQRWFVELKRRGVPAELLLFPGEGHELTRSGRPTHRRARFEHVLTWWSKHLPVG
jgi:dipeptidyl aminopeptidase/acylaminoacyl peptidase